LIPTSALTFSAKVTSSGARRRNCSRSHQAERPLFGRSVRCRRVRWSAHQPVAHQLADKSCGISLRITAGGVRPHRGEMKSANVHGRVLPRRHALPIGPPVDVGLTTFSLRGRTTPSHPLPAFLATRPPPASAKSPCLSVIWCHESCHASRRPLGRGAISGPPSPRLAF
jgi:hypothetical protein